MNEFDLNAEMDLCKQDFTYFCKEYVIINDKKFDLYDYQKRYIAHIENNKKSLCLKFRQGGFTTLLNVFILWKCLFEKDMKSLLLFADQASADLFCEKTKTIMSLLPKWMGGFQEVSENTIQFFKSGSVLNFANYDKKISANLLDYIYLDEVHYWKKTAPIYLKIIDLISGENNCKIIANSSIDISKNEFVFKEPLYADFEKFTCYYKENPSFTDEWEKQKLESIGHYKWCTEYLCLPYSKQTFEENEVTYVPNKDYTYEEIKAIINKEHIDGQSRNLPKISLNTFIWNDHDDCEDQLDQENEMALIITIVYNINLMSKDDNSEFHSNRIKEAQQRLPIQINELMQKAMALPKQESLKLMKCFSSSLIDFKWTEQFKL